MGARGLGVRVAVIVWRGGDVGVREGVVEGVVLGGGVSVGDERVVVNEGLGVEVRVGVFGLGVLVGGSATRFNRVERGTGDNRLHSLSLHHVRIALPQRHGPPSQPVSLLIWAHCWGWHQSRSQFPTHISGSWRRAIS